MAGLQWARFGAGAVVLVTIAALSAACGGSDGPAEENTLGLANPGTITAAITSDGAPFASTDADGQPVGLLIDLNNHIAEQMGLKIVYKSIQMDAGFAALTAGQFDMMSIGLIETPERKKNVAFTDPIYWSQNVVMVRGDAAIASINDLGGKRVGVAQNSAQAEYAAEHFKTAKLVQEPDSISGVNQLLNGNLDSFFIGSAGASIVIPQHPGKLKVVDSVYLDSPSAQAVSKSKTAFLQAYNVQLKKAADDGTLLKIYDKYFQNAGLSFPEELYQYYPQVKQQMQARQGASPSPSPSA